jgi:hypothetical protein
MPRIGHRVIGETLAPGAVAVEEFGNRRGVATWERDIMLERQREGIAKATPKIAPAFLADARPA